MDSKLSRWCDGVIEAGWLAAIILTPLFFNIHSDRVFEPDKLTLLRSIAVMMLAVWLVKFVEQRRWEGVAQRLAPHSAGSIWRMPFILPVGLLALVYLVSNIFSVTPAISWAGSYQRLQGTYTTLSYLIIFLVTISTMRTSAQARRVVTAVIITSIPVAFYGLLQHFDLDPLPWAGDTTQRVAGHMGNAIFIAAYLIMAVPLTLSRIIVSFNNILNDEDLSAADVVRSSVYIFTLAIQLITIYWSGSRGPWIGLFVGLFAFVLIVLVALRNAAAENGRFQLIDGGKAILLVAIGVVAFPIFNLLLGSVGQAAFAPAMRSFLAFVAAVGMVVLAIFVMIAAQQGWRWLWLSWIVLSVALGSWLVLFNLPPESTEGLPAAPLFETLDEWRGLPTIGRLGTVLEADSGTGKVRTLIWEGVLELISPHEPLSFPDGRSDRFNFLRPLIGYGPESMYVAYNRFYPPELATVEARNASPDRSHNETFDALVITGWLGFLAWQFLYLSVFYYGFKWLGILNGKRDRNLLIALWIGAGALVAVLFATLFDLVFVGVAFPFGSIIGLIVYLIYFALLGQSPAGEGVKRPFDTNRMLMIGLVAAVLAHYVEIHFGIAIASSRTHFFLYLGIMFVIGHMLPQINPNATFVNVDDSEEAEPVEEPVKKGRRKRGRRRGRQTTPRRNPVGSLLGGSMMLSLFIMSLITGTIGYTYITYNQIDGREYTGAADLPIGEVVNQSFFVDSGSGFADSPFVFVMLVLVWALGILLIISEMVKDGELTITPTLSLEDGERMQIVAALAVVGLLSLGARLLVAPPPDSGSAFLLGRSLLAAYGAGALITAVLLYLKTDSSQFIAGALAVVGFACAFPVFLAGGWWQGILLLLINGALFYRVRHGEWGRVLTRTAGLAVGSFGIGLFYTFVHSTIFRNALFFRPTQQIDSLSQYRILESSQAATFLTVYYLFVFSLIMAAAYLSAAPDLAKIRDMGSGVGYSALGLLGVVTIGIIGFTNLRIIQADMIFKRGRFFDGQASQTQQPDLWESAIAIYNRSISLAPREDYYYLFLGRAFLENSGLVQEEAQRTALLAEAEQRLLDAQDINPLNTDHTANLARLNTRRIGFASSEAQSEALVEAAESYYIDALALSPQNSIIRNEYARLSFDLLNDCDQAIGLFEDSIEIDPFYSDSYFWLVDTYVRCAQASTDSDQQEVYYDEAVRVIEEGLELQPTNARAWLRASQLYAQLEQPDAGLAALDKVRELDPNQQVLAEWNYNFSKAQLLRAMGDEQGAIDAAEIAANLAPPDFATQTQLLLSELTGEEFVPPPEPESDAGETAVTEQGTLEGERPLATIPAANRDGIFPEYPSFVIDVLNEYEAVINTEKGQMRFALFAEEAPLTVNNFVYLANQGYYDNTTFHRVLEGFMAQAGDPTGTGFGGPGYQFEDETDNGFVFDRAGLLAMANAGPNTNGSQFFVTFVPTPQLNGDHTIFGELIEGGAVLSNISFRNPQTDTEPGDTILSIEIVERTP